MATITDIKRRIQELAPAPFQEFCDVLISKNGFGKIHGFGMKAGTGNTTIGNPDSYFRKENGKYGLVAYTIQQTSIYSKLKEDIEKCLDSSKTGLNISEIEEIICCHISSNLSAGEDKLLHDYCEKKGVKLTIWGIDEIANQVHNKFPSLSKRYLGLSIDTNQIVGVDDFIELCDSNGISAPLKTNFLYRENEKKEIINLLKSFEIVVVTGKAGVGKTRLVLEVVQEFAEKEDYNILCVKNNNLSLYEDLIFATENSGNYLFFVDDANEFAQLNHILRYTKKKGTDSLVKIILTVRDYAKENVIDSVTEYVSPRIIKISSFSDDQIKGFITDNFGITNNLYLDQIIKISEGNPRIAYMAGKLAIEENKLSAIRNVSELYDLYYRKYIDVSLGNDRDLCFVAGILSIINGVILDDLSPISQLLSIYGMSNDEFTNKIFELSKLEFVEIKLDYVATLSDQCLSNYMIYYVFFKKRIFSFSKMLEIGYKNFHNSIIKAVSMVLNLFESQETIDYCENSIKEVWDNLKKENHQCYERYVQDFHLFRPEEGFITAKEKIDNIANKGFIAKDVSFSEGLNEKYDSILNLLTNYHNSKYLNYVLELYIDFISKSCETMVSGCNWLKKYYGISLSDCNYNYYTQIKISEFLLEKVVEKNSISMVAGLKWATYSLDFLFNSFETSRGDKVSFSSITLQESESLRKYRNLCWRIVLFIASDTEWRGEILDFLNLYSKYLFRNPVKGIIENDLISICQLIDKIKCYEIGFLNIINNIKYKVENLELVPYNNWDDILCGELWDLYQLLRGHSVTSRLDYEEFKLIRENDLIEFGKTIHTNDINKMVHNVNVILSDKLVNESSYDINSGLVTIVKQFNELKLIEFINAFIHNGENISISPNVVIYPLNHKSNSLELLALIKNADFPQKNDWMFSFFETLPKIKINYAILDELLSFLKNDSDREGVSSEYRNLNFLDNFLSLESNIYPIVSSIIYEKKRYCESILYLYFELLFYEDLYSPSDLIELYKGDLDILQEIYFFVLKNKEYTDISRSFFIAFSSLSESWLQKYSDVFWDFANNSFGRSQYGTDALWKADNYIKYFDYIFYHFPKNKYHRLILKTTFEHILSNTEDNIIKERKQQWIDHIITQNIYSENILQIFNIISMLDNDTRRSAINKFIDLIPGFEEFDRLQLSPTSWVGDETFIQVYKDEIIFLESLYPMFSNIQYLKHRAKIVSLVEKFKEMIHEEERNYVSRNLYR